MEQTKEIRISKMGLLFLAAIPLAVIAGIVFVRDVAVERPASAAVGEERVSTASVNGIDVSIDDVQRTGGKTLVVMTMSNHQYDLSDPLIGERSSLDGLAPEKFDVIENAMGGHHVVAEMWFDGELYGELVVVMTENAILNFSV